MKNKKPRAGRVQASTDAPRLNRETLRHLRGYVVAFQNPADSPHPGWRTGLVREVGARTLVVQAPSHPAASTRSARYRGDRYRIDATRLRIVQPRRGCAAPLTDFLARRIEA